MSTARPFGALRQTIARSLLTVLILVAVIGSAPSRAVGQEPEPVVNSWAFAPTGTDPNEPSSRPFFSYDLAPGAGIDDSVTLWNYGNVQLTFRVYPTDAFNNDGGDFDALPGDKEPSDLGRWVTLSKEYVTVPASSKVDVPFRLDVPANARSGDHAAALLAASEVEGVDSDGRVVTVDRRTGSRMYVKVAGPETPALTVENIYSVYHPSVNPFGGSLDVTYTVRNSGNLRLGGSQEIVVRNPFGSEMARLTPDDLPELLPNNAINLTAHFDGVTAAFRVTTEITVRPMRATGAGADPASGTVLAAVSRSGSTWAIPFSAIVAAVIGWGAWRKLRKERAKRRARRDGPAGPPPPSAPDHDRALVT